MRWCSIEGVGRATELTILICVCCASACVADERVELGTRQTQVVGGTSDVRDPAVVAIVKRRIDCDAPTPSPICTGTLVAPRVVLTAAHCLESLTGDEGYEVFFGNRIGASGSFVLVDETRRHPGYSSNTHVHDLALLRLVEDAPVAPVALPGKTLGSGSIGASARVVGFGVLTVSDDGSAGTKREGVTRVEELSLDSFRAVASPAMTCAGDSGGPVFVMLDSTEQFLGVTSVGDRGCKDYAQNARIDVSLADFILPYIEETKRPVSRGAPTVTLGGICDRQCGDLSDCPSQLACVRTSIVGRCQLPSLAAGAFTTECTARSQCGAKGRCARLSPSMCRCYTSCADLAPDWPITEPPDAGPSKPAAPNEPTTVRGSCAHSRSESIAPVAMIAFFAALSAIRRRRSGSRLEDQP